MVHKIYTCVLLDDELLALAYMRTLCEEIPEIQVIKAYNDPEVFLHELKDIQFDFLISDIVMPSLTGLEVASKLIDKPIIFTTAHNEYAADAFDIEAIDYLRKPVKIDRLKKAISKTLVELSNRQLKWNVTTSKGKMTFICQHTVSITTSEFDSRDKIILLNDGSTETIKNKSFQQIEEDLKSEKLIRISKSEIFNLRYFHGFNSDIIFSSLKSSDGKSLSFSVSENYRKEVSDYFKKRD